ncbi:lachesin, partial [Cimex lectularius]|uniref:Ig-like domain-containing protein n=1 Tax=Cimex lectularius TaxID=79782 RepID=A0A8I6TKR5_CIMLE
SKSYGYVCSVLCLKFLGSWKRNCVGVQNALGLEPDFLFPLENLTIAQGRDAMFTCVVNNLGGYRVAWIKADTKAILAIHEHVITNNQRLSVTHNDDNTWTLNMRGVRREDRGTYMCQVNTDPMKSQSAYLEVVIPPDIIYEETSGDMMTPEGGSAKLVCKARGYPPPKITWRREDGGEIILRQPATGHKAKVTSFEGETLILSKVTRSEMGVYMCIASNGVPPTVSKRLMLHVNFHPLIQVPNQLVGAPPGTNVTLQCLVEASPKAINYWTRQSGEMIVQSPKYEMKETAGPYYTAAMLLTIKDIQKSDLGGYNCVSKNSIGDAEGSIRLYTVPVENKKKMNDDGRYQSEDEDDFADEDDDQNGSQGSLREEDGEKDSTKDNSLSRATPGASSFFVSFLLPVLANFPAIGYTKVR